MNNYELTPFLSVIVPIYNVEAYLKECIESIINQTYKNLEILLIDDGSKGNESAICDAYALKDSRIKVIHKKNGGLVAARKTGLKYASSSYVTFIDGDDYISPTYYEQMMNWVINEDPDIVSVSFTQVTDSTQNIVLQKMDTGIYEGERYLYLISNMNCKEKRYYDFGIFPSTCLKIYKTELLLTLSQNIPNHIRMGEDSAFTFPYLLNSKKIIVDNTISGYFYRILPASMSHTTDEGLFTATSDLYNYLKPHYYKTANTDVISQLELYRAYISMLALDYWMSNVKLTNIHATTAKIRKLANQSLLFKDLSILLDLNLPEYLNKNFELINKSKWRTFELLWMKKSLLSCLHIMVQKILRKVSIVFSSKHI